MVQNYWYIFSIILLFSCNSNSVNKHDINNKDLDQMANKFYKGEKIFRSKTVI